FTPHSGEFGGLTGLSPGDIEARPLAAALDYAERERVILVLKGPVTFIAYPGGRYVVVEGLNPSLAAGGSGDVLAGIIGGLLAAGLSPQDAAAAGVCLHQEAGRLAFRKGWFAPGELLPFLRALLGKVQRERAKEGE
ncbi:MAG: NAD(P)H-hydrate dehydratase, partial [Spirochaetales bacterium]|nr:NAD(P)H-hydrate dehydratase [Spirochaetales bacterium]